MTIEKAQNINQPWWRGATIYQIYPRSFRDSNGDGVGDLRGIIEKLPYVASLGVDAIWISPFFKSPMKDFGYDVSDFCAIDQIFGTMEDFDELLKSARDLGLRIIIDQVYSHTSDEHPWFLESKSNTTNSKAEWYVWANPKLDGSPPNNWQSVFHGPSWEWNSNRNQYYFHNFLPEQPDLNLHNIEVQNEILNVAKFWLDKGVDGFRLDALNFSMHDPLLRDNPINPRIGERTRPFDYQDKIYSMSHPDIPIFLEKLSKLINSYPDKFTVAEVGGELALKEMKEFTKGSDRLNTAYGFKFLYAEELNKETIISALNEWKNDGLEEWPSHAFSNHDAPRAISRWANGRDLAAMSRLCTALLCAMRGNIFIYQGEELALPQASVAFEHLVDPEAIKNWPKTLGRDGARTPMVWENSPNGGFGGENPWLPIDKCHLPLAVNEQEKQTNSNLNQTREIIKIRQSLPELLWGNLEIIDCPESLLILRREYEGNELFCAFNLGNRIEDLPFAPKEIIYSNNGADDKKLPPLGVLYFR